MKTYRKIGKTHPAYERVFHLKRLKLDVCDAVTHSNYLYLTEVQEMLKELTK